MAFSDPIFKARDKQELIHDKTPTMEAWLDNRAYSTWPMITTWEVRKRQLVWQARLMRTQFSATYIYRTLYGTRTNKTG